MTATCTICRQIIRPSLVLDPKFGIKLPANTTITPFARLYVATMEHFSKDHQKEVGALQELTMVWLMWSHAMLLECNDREFLAARNRAHDTLRNLIVPAQPTVA